MPPALHTEHTPDPVTPLSPRLPQTEGQSLPGAREAALVLFVVAGMVMDGLIVSLATPQVEDVATLNPQPVRRGPV